MGKGLSALLKDNGEEVTSAQDEQAPEIIGNIAEIAIDRITENPHQPRTLFHEEALEELAASVQELGIIQPITVRKVPEGDFQIISGERRYRAAKKAGLDTIPAYVRLADDQEMLEMALVENIQREELDSIEIALSYERLIEECELTQAAMSERVGKKRSTITNYLRLLKLQPLIQAGLRDKMISMGHARSLVNIDDEESQLELYRKAIAREWSVRQTEDAVKKLKEGKTKSPGNFPSSPELPQEYAEIQNNLANKLDTSVELKRSKRGKGRIVIPFANDRELKRLLQHLQESS